jgi:hypothetical protein
VDDDGAVAEPPRGHRTRTTGADALELAAHRVHGGCERIQ